MTFSETETAVWFLRQHGGLLPDLLGSQGDSDQARSAAFMLQAWQTATLNRQDLLRETESLAGLVKRHRLKGEPTMKYIQHDKDLDEIAIQLAR